MSESEEIEALADEELDAEITIAAHDPVRRSNRFAALVAELVNRQRGQAAGLRHHEGVPDTPETA